MILLFIFALLFLFYVKRKGIDFYLLLAAACFAYYYPIIFFDTIFVFKELGSGLVTDQVARLTIISGILFLLFSGYYINSPLRPKLITSNNTDRFYIKTISFFMLFLMIIIIYQNGFGLEGRSKTELMENLGYTHKLYNSVSFFVIANAVLTKKKSLYFLSFLAVFFDLLFGFRASMGGLIVMYLLSQREISQKKILLSSFLAPLGITLLLIAKETAYFTRDFNTVLSTLNDAFINYGSHALMLANPESSSTSAVFNQVVTTDFSIPLTYLTDSFLSFFPFLNKIGFEPIGFASYYKGILFGAEGDSFASGMLSVSYALGSFIGVFITFTLLIVLGHSYHKIDKNTNPIKLVYRATAMVFATTIILTFFRSDLIYLVGVLRTSIVIGISITILENIFLKKKNNNITYNPILQNKASG